MTNETLPPKEAVAAKEILTRLQKGDVQTAWEMGWIAITNDDGMFGKPFSRFRFIEQLTAQLQMLREEAQADKDPLLPPPR